MCGTENAPVKSGGISASNFKRYMKRFYPTAFKAGEEKDDAGKSKTSNNG